MGIGNKKSRLCLDFFGGEERIRTSGTLSSTQV